MGWNINNYYPKIGTRDQSRRRIKLIGAQNSRQQYQLFGPEPSIVTYYFQIMEILGMWKSNHKNPCCESIYLLSLYTSWQVMSHMYRLRVKLYVKYSTNIQEEKESMLRSVIA